MSETEQPRLMTADECRAWVEKYRDVPFNALSLRCSADGDPSPMRLIASLLRLAGLGGCT